MKSNPNASQPKAKPGPKGPFGPTRWTPTAAVKVAQDLLAWLPAHPGAVCIEEFCLAYPRPFSISRLSELDSREGFEIFSELYAQAKSAIKVRWLRGGGIRDVPVGKDGCMLTTRLEPNIARIVLQSDHNMKERVESDSHISGGLTFTDLAHQLAEATARRIPDEDQERHGKENSGIRTGRRS